MIPPPQPAFPQNTAPHGFIQDMTLFDSLNQELFGENFEERGVSRLYFSESSAFSTADTVMVVQNNDLSTQNVSNGTAESIPEI